MDLLALLYSSLTLLDWDLARHGVRVSLDVQALSTQGGAPVAGDGVMLQQVLVNLLRNAIDAMADSPPGERRLSVSSRVDDAGEHLEITIADTGCGIGEDAAGQLFMPFFTTKPTGMGVGLNICRSLIELHQGRLWFTHNEERGCTFHVALPLVPDAASAQLPRFHDCGGTCP
ncbi:MAG: sensor histidine kinase [Giesbergeria sp.]